jgi:hypothetical protein
MERPRAMMPEKSVQPAMVLKRSFMLEERLPGFRLSAL